VQNLKSLVVFYSRTGNARWVAETVAAQIGADTEEIVDKKKRGGVLGYLGGGSDARRGKKTEIEPTKRSPADYDLIVIGSPIWAGRATPAITTWIKKNNLADKQVAVFFVQGGKNKSQGLEQMKTLLSISNYLGVLSLISPLENKEGCEKEISDWCRTLLS
jgi:flavodoxin